MFKKNLKRCLAVLLTVMMLVSSLPTGVFATELESTVTETEHDHEHDHDHVNEDAVEFIEGSLTEDEELTTQVPEVTDTVTDAALGESESEEEIVTDTDTESAITDSASSVTDENVTDEDITVDNITDEDIIVDDTITDEATKAVSGTLTDANIGLSNSNGTWTASGTTITGSHSVYMAGGTSTLTITNSNEFECTLKFNYSTSVDDDDSYVKIVNNGTGGTLANHTGSTSANGTIETTLSAGQTVTVTLNAGSAWFATRTTSITITDIELISNVKESNVTILHNSSLGNITVAGTDITSDSYTQTVPVEGIVLSATAENGSTFYAWAKEDGTILSTEVSYTLIPSGDTTVKALFAKSDAAALFRIGSNVVFDDLNTAVSYAQANSATKIVLAADGTLPAGNYTIPSGITLLIPFDTADTLYTTSPANTGTYTTPTAFRTLTMADGANLVVNGSLSLSAQHKYAQGSKLDGGAPTGPVSFIKMQGSSNITVNSGGVLYAYGYITGSGSVTANSGAKVYELFQIADFRGGTQTTEMDNRVFPLSQYYVQNIEVPLTLYSGATEYSFTTLYMSRMAISTSVAFIGSSGCMFNLTDGYVVKRYDGATDRLIVESYGTLAVSPIEMKVSIKTLDSADYVLGINGNITVDVKSGSIALNQDVAFLPGSEIIVGEGVTCTLGSGNKVYIYDMDQWNTYCGSTDKWLIPVIYAPSRTYTRTKADLKDAKLVVKGTVDASAGFLYTTAGGAAITGTEGAKVTITSGTDTVTYQLRQTASTYDEIPITSAKLMNADGTYTETLNSTNLQYTYENGVWAANCSHPAENEITLDGTPATCTQPGMTPGLKCGNCGKILTEQEVIPATGHSLEDVAGKDATCTTDGYTAYKACKNCDYIEGKEVITAFGHTEETVPGKAATCTTSGLTEGKKCSVCGTETVEQTVIPALGHDHQLLAEGSTPATCTSAGQNSFKCSRCGDSYTETIPALGHDYVAVVTAPTCEEGGFTTNTCSRCTSSYVDAYTDALGHETSTETIAATCEADGKTVTSCSRCDYEVVTTINKLGHDYKTETTDPTCTEAGQKVTTCSRCDYNAVETIPATGHSLTDVKGKEATCEEDGYTAYKACSKCDYTEGYEVITAPGHVEVIFTEAKAPTCTEPGVKAYIYCETCGDVIQYADEIPALGHSYETTVVEPGCVSQGYTTYYCPVCGDFTQDDFRAALGHSYDEGVITTEPTCTDKGEKTYTCSACGDKKTEEVDALDHDYVATVTAPTCVDKGYTTHDCSRCEESYVDTYVDALGHSYDEGVITKAPTCTEEGEKTFTCSACGDTKTEAVEKLSHNYESVVTKPTCEEEGYTTYTCSACGDTYTADKVAAFNHTFIKDAYKAPTCTETGLTEGSHCDRCGKVHVAQNEIPALNHDIVIDEAVEPTCTETGLTEGQHCTRCNDATVAQNVVDKLGHDIITLEAKEATCTEDGLTAGQYCSRCDDETIEQEVIEAPGHSYDDGVITTEPSCTADGVKTYTCSVCDDKKTEAVKALGHKYDAVVTDPTCTEDGFTTYTCSVCGDTYKDDVVTALNHDYKGVVTSPTCTEDGYTTYTCSRCGDTYTADAVAALDHDYKAVVTPATCIADGYTTYTCSRCGDSYVADTVAALGHSYDSVVTPPTCVAGGYTTNTCSVCGYVTVTDRTDAIGHNYVIDEEASYEAECEKEGYEKSVCSNCGDVVEKTLEALEHIEVVDEAKEATCTATGLTIGSHCERCGETLVEQQVVPMKDHSYEVTAEIPADCESDGLRKSKCSVCGKTISEILPALGHDMVPVPVRDATCTEDGESASSKCSRCDYTEEGSVIPALGHNYVLDEEASYEAKCEVAGFERKVCSRCGDVTEKTLEALEHNYIGVVTAPTCLFDGFTTYTCELCGDSYKADTVEALGHNEVKIEAIPVTCLTDGYTEGSKCDRCQVFINEPQLIPSEGHKEEAIPAVEPTCTTLGSKDGVKCSVCGVVLTEPTPIDSLGHEFVYNTVAPTCTDGGYTEETCSRNCGYYKQINPTDKLGHSYDTVVTAPTCAEDGYTTYTCSVCGDTYTDDIVGKLGHSYDAVVTAPTCDDKGFTTYTCSSCGDTYTADEVDALGHDYDDGVITLEPTCTEAGKKVITCKRGCGDHYTETVPATGHSYDAVVTAPDCENKGFTTYTCSACGHSYTDDEVDALGHKYDAAVTAPTCTEDGYTTYTCSVCGDTYTDDVVDALGHSYDAVVTAPACEAKGYTTYTCSVCGDTYVADEVDALGHNYVGEVTKDPTCTEEGVKTFTCSACGDTYTESVAILGHDYTATVTAPTCVDKGFTTYDCSRCEESYVDDYVDALGHEYDAVITDPTCTEDGYTTYTCSVCGDTYTDDIVDKLGHKYDAVVTAPTCIKPGFTTYTCSACGDTYTADEVEALGHNYVGEVTKEPGCETTGVRTYTCSVCDSFYTETIDATGHTKVTLPAVEPTCNTPGKTEGEKCSVCNKVFTAQKVVNKLGHDIITLDAKEATCTETGLTAGQYCTRCDAVTVDQEIVDALGHDIIIDEAVEPTCTEAGLTEGQHCSRCDAMTVAQDVVDALGHDIVIDAAVEPTCTETGLTEGQHCSRCDGETVAQVEVPANGHTPVTDAAVEATCTQKGKTEGSHCGVCGKVLTPQGETPELGHNMAYLSRVEPTCTETGLTAGEYCTRCDDATIAQIEIAALGHDKVTDKAIEATCLDTGLTEAWHCSRCDAKEEQVEVAALGHDYEVVIIAPTCVKDGYNTNTCKRCGDFFTSDFVTKLGHTEVIDAKVDATCLETGLTEGSHCSVCGYVIKTQVAIPAKGHTEVVDAKVEPTCTETGLTEGSHCSVCGEVILAQEEIPAKGHDIQQYVAQLPTYTDIGWDAFEACSRCDYTTKVEIPALGEPSITDFDSFMENLILLEEFAKEFARANPGNDPLMLVIKYIRTGVDRYNSGSWGIMAGYENADFAKYVTEAEAAYNKNAASIDDYLKVTGLKNIEYFTLPNGDYVDFGHMFGTMDITYHNKGSENHADVAGWAGDLVDLMSATDRHNVDGTVEEMVAEISEKYLCSKDLNEADIFSEKDMLGDLDGYFVMNELYKSDYESGDMYELFKSYFTASLTIEDRAAYFLENRLGGSGTKTATREAVYEAYTANKVVSTLEGTREFIRDDLTDLRTACCYSFADFLCKLAGDYVESVDNKFYTVFSTEKSTLAPGITQEKHKAYTADDKQIVYYVATADINSEYVHVYANYKDNDPTSWGMARVLDQANAAQAKYGDPASPHYIENYNVIASINGDGYNMTTGEPGGLLVMGGVEYHPVDGGGFFAITKDGKAVIGTQSQYAAMKDDIAEAVGGFGTTLIKDGKISITASSNYYVNRASRTSVGITKTGKVVFMVLDGRQEPVSCGGSMEEIAQIMLDAGCVHAINLDGGGSSTYVAREEGATELAVVSVPSDGYARSVSTSLMMVSTAPSSTEFDHAVVDADKSYLTIGSTTQLTASGVSAMGNSTDIPEGATWAVSDEALGTVSADGIFTAKANGTVEVYLMLDGNVVGEKKLNIVVPDTVYFKKDNIDAVYGETFKLPVIALYEGKEVAINENDITMIPANPAACVIEGFNFTGIEESGVKNVIVTAVLNADESVKGEVTVSLYNQGEATFDFDQAIGGNRQFAWDRQVSNSTTDDNVVYNVIDPAEDMVTSYIFAIDMTQIPIPEQLADLTTMLPGADAEDACAWNFLLQLAERISVLTTVKPQVVFDKNFDVDYSDLTIVNEYFELNGTEFDEETNTLTLTLNWIDQTQAIDPTMANPICILSGIKLTPKDTAAWDAKDRLNPVNSGNISYDIYMRASALYSFAQKPENQEVYGVYPFVNPNDESEKGGHFGSVYCQFTDTYTLVKSLKNGWVMEDGGYAYYVSGEKTYGVALIDGLYYDFGTNGINSGKTPYTGIFDVDGVNYYAKFGKLASGWVVIDNQKYYFDENGKGLDGKEVVDEVEYEFDNGLLVGGYTGIVKKSNGRSYYYIDGEMQFNWHKIGEYWYHFHDEDGWMTTGYHQYPDDKTTFYDFADDGRLLYGSFRSSGYYYWAGQPLQDSWVQISAEPDDWYRTNGSGHFVTDLTSNPTVRILIDGVIYTFDNTNGKLIKGNFVTEGSNIYYYWAGKPLTSGWFEHDGDTYYAFSDGHLATGEQTIDGKNYKFDDKGALIKEENVKTVPMYRMYNPNSGEHFYTGSTEERDILVKAGWNYEGVAFNFPVVGKPVYRLYEPITGEHLYTMDEAEKAKLLAEGWNYEGVAFNSAGEDEVPQYRLHNPNATCGAYHFTGSTEERDILIKAGWEYQGIGWYSCVK